MEEQWLSIAGFSRYVVSNLGRVRSRENRLLVPLASKPGSVPVVILNDDEGKPVARKVVRLVCDAFMYDPDGYSAVAHQDGDKTNCRVSNLVKLGDPDKQVSSRSRSHKPKPVVVIRKGSSYIGLEPPIVPEPIVQKRSQVRVALPVKVNETGKVYSSVAKMSRELGLDASTVGKLLRGDARQNSHRGLTFSYAEEVPKDIDNYPISQAVQKQRIYCVNNDQMYDTQSDAARDLGISQAGVSRVLLGKSAHTKGYTFQYVMANA